MCQSSGLEDGPLSRSHTCVVFMHYTKGSKDWGYPVGKMPWRRPGHLTFYGKTLRPYIPLSPG